MNPDPTSRGFGFVVLEWPATLVDWGTRSSRSTTIEREIGILSKIADLIWQYRPQSVILEKFDCSESRPTGRVRLLLAGVKNLTTWEKVKIRSVSSAKLRNVFLTFGTRNKHEIAQVVGQQLPDLAAYLPRPRKPWMTEDYRMAIFDAAALALAYFYMSKILRNVLGSTDYLTVKNSQ